MTCRRGSQDTRGRILEVALRMFARQGYVTTTMEEIAREVGVTKPAIYHHFKGKDAIFLALIHLLQDEMLASLDKARARHLPLPGLLEALFRDRLSQARDHPDWCQFLFRIDVTRRELPEIAELVRMHDELERLVEALISETLGDQGLRDGVTVPRIVEFVHDTLMAYVGRTTLHEGTGIGDVAAEARRLRDFLLFGVCGRP